MLCSKAYAIHRKSKEVVQKHNTSCAKGSNGAEVIPTNRDKIHLLSRNKDQIPKNVEELWDWNIPKALGYKNGITLSLRLQWAQWQNLNCMYVEILWVKSEEINNMHTFDLIHCFEHLQYSNTLNYLTWLHICMQIRDSWVQKRDMHCLWNLVLYDRIKLFKALWCIWHCTMNVIETLARFWKVTCKVIL